MSINSITRILNGPFKELSGLAEGVLLETENAPGEVIRHTLTETVGTPEEQLKAAALITRETNKMIELEIPVIDFHVVALNLDGDIETPNPLALACRKLTGKTVEDELLAGNNQAVQAYGKVLVGVADYFFKSIYSKDSVMGDIVMPYQYTWQDDGPLLHDLSNIFQPGEETLELLEMHGNFRSNYNYDMAMLNLSHVALALAGIFPRLDGQVYKDIIERFDAALGRTESADTYGIYLRLAKELPTGTDIAQIMLDMETLEHG
jgi:hypothetical protein